MNNIIILVLWVFKLIAKRKPLTVKRLQLYRKRYRERIVYLTGWQFALLTVHIMQLEDYITFLGLCQIIILMVSLWFFHRDLDGKESSINFAYGVYTTFVNKVVIQYIVRIAK